MKILNTVLFLTLFVLISCSNHKNDNSKPTNQVNPDEYLEDLEQANKYFIVNEDDQISEYSNRYGWKMDKTGTGLRYYIYEHGNGKEVENDMIVKFDFVVNLLNGTVCYDSKQMGAKEIRIGKAEVVSGLEEGLLLLRQGDRAKFIIPSHLAFGWLGDSDKIPTRAVLIYDVKVLEVRNYLPEIY